MWEEGWVHLISTRSDNSNPACLSCLQYLRISHYLRLSFIGRSIDHFEGLVVQSDRFAELLTPCLTGVRIAGGRARHAMSKQGLP